MEERKTRSFKTGLFQFMYNSGMVCDSDVVSLLTRLILSEDVRNAPQDQLVFLCDTTFCPYINVCYPTRDSVMITDDVRGWQHYISNVDLENKTALFSAGTHNPILAEIETYDGILSVLVDDEVVSLVIYKGGY